MSHGTIQAVGTTLRLKKRFGKGYKMTMFVDSPSALSKIDEFMKAKAPAGEFSISFPSSSSPALSR